MSGTEKQSDRDVCGQTGVTKPECCCRECAEAMIAEAMRGQWRSSVNDEPLERPKGNEC